MSKEERSTYFNEAEHLSALHKRKYPNWSNQVNYVRSTMPLTQCCICSRVVFAFFREKRGEGTKDKLELVL